MCERNVGEPMHGWKTIAKKVGLLTLAAAVMSGSLASCALSADRTIDCDFNISSDPAPEGGRDVAIVISPTSSFVDFGDALDASSAIINEALGKKGARVSVILADGNPGLVRQTIAMGADSDEGQRILNDQMVDGLRNVYYCAVDDAEHPTKNFDKSLIQAEVDMLAALDKATGAFDPETTIDNRRIVVIGNAIQTAGQYSFISSGIPREAEVGVVVNSLREAKVLPQLDGVRVDLVGLALVNEQEPALNKLSTDGITIFWTRVIEASGGIIGTLIAQIPQGAPSKGSVKTSSAESLAKPCINESVAEADGITFQPGRASFVDVSAATATASVLASKISESGCTGDLTVIGYVTSEVDMADFNPNDSESRDLSLARAEAFKGLLIAAGVTSNIITVGGGKGPINEWSPDGRYNATEGAKNRKVVVTQ